MTQVTLLDGGMSRELERCGATLQQPEWSALALINEPEKVRAAHEAFVAAGSKVITTNSYAVVPFHLGEDRFAQDGAALAARAGRLAQEAATTSTGVQVAGSLPPACGSYIPDQFNPDEARRILSVLVENMAPYVDIWLAETLSSLEEARVTAEVAKASGKPFWISYTLRDTADALVAQAPLLRSGEPVAEAVHYAVEIGADAVLFNCSLPEVMEQAVRVAKEVIADQGAAVPIGVYANALGSQDEEEGANEVISEVRADLDPAGYGTWVDLWISAGATLVGGCCGITSPHIAALSARLAPKG